MRTTSRPECILPCNGVALLALLWAAVLLPSSAAQTFSSYAALEDSLNAVASITDAQDRGARLDALWDILKADGQVPFRVADSAAFLYRGSANSVSFPGDFNGWSPAGSAASRMAGTDLWIREEVFPDDARLDYKIVLNGSSWILDPANPLRQKGGFGYNSEIRMPAYEPSPYLERRPGVPSGELSPNLAHSSSALGYAVTFRVYTPPGYHSDQLTDLPVLYVTDGHEYADDEMGSLRVVLDNLIAEGRIRHVLTVFIDPRVNGSNRRQEQYVENPAFASFVADELVPRIDSEYRTDPRREARAILGTSLGGLNGAYFGATRPETFGLLGLQSPAFRWGPTIYDLYRSHPHRDLRVHMSWGSIHDVADAAETMSVILADKSYAVEEVVVSEGHSWGQWRALVDDVLMYFWGGTVLGSDAQIPDSAPGMAMYPNPVSERLTIAIPAGMQSILHLTVFNILGQEIHQGVLDPTQGIRHVSVTDFAPGVYMARLTGGGGQIVGTQTFLVAR